MILLTNDLLTTFSENKQPQFIPVLQNRIYCSPEYDCFIQNSGQFTSVKMELKVYFHMIKAHLQA